MTDQRKYVESVHGEKSHIVDNDVAHGGRKQTLCGLKIGRFDRVVGISEKTLCATCSLVLRRRSFGKADKASPPPPATKKDSLQARWEVLCAQEQRLLTSKARMNAKRTTLDLIQQEKQTLLENAVKQAAEHAKAAAAEPFNETKRYEVRSAEVAFQARIDTASQQALIPLAALQQVMNALSRRTAPPAPTPRGGSVVFTLSVEGFSAEMTEHSGVVSMTVAAYRALGLKLCHMKDELGRLRRITDKLLEG